MSGTLGGMPIILKPRERRFAGHGERQRSDAGLAPRHQATTSARGFKSRQSCRFITISPAAKMIFRLPKARYYVSGDFACHPRCRSPISITAIEFPDEGKNLPLDLFVSATASDRWSDFGEAHAKTRIDKCRFKNAEFTYSLKPPHAYFPPRHRDHEV